MTVMRWLSLVSYFLGLGLWKTHPEEATGLFVLTILWGLWDIGDKIKDSK